MSRPAGRLPDYLRMECVYICKGYRHRRSALARRLLAIGQGSAQAERYRADPEVQKVLAVQEAMGLFAPDVAQALMANIVDGVPYEHLQVPMGRGLFYRSRRRLLAEVARRMGYAGG